MAGEASPTADDADTGTPSVPGGRAVEEPVRAGDRVLLTLEDANAFLVRMDPGRTHSTHKGAIAHDDVIGRAWGSRLRTNTGEPVCALRPTWVDEMMKVDRRTIIMYPKDVSYVLALLGLTAGRRVVELGSGSGAMTQALARAVGPGGKVFSYDRRSEFLQLAAANCAEAGIDEEVEFRLRQPGDPLEPGVDAVFCDIPEPWSEVAAAWAALRGSGRFAAALPTFNQAEKLVAVLESGRIPADAGTPGERPSKERPLNDRGGDGDGGEAGSDDEAERGGAAPAGGFAGVETVEVLHRRILARPGRTRPAHRMVGHTQLLISAVKVVDVVEDEEDESAAP